MLIIYFVFGQTLRFPSLEEEWSSLLLGMSGYTSVSLAPACRRICKIHREIGESEYKATLKKYESIDCNYVSHIPPLLQ